MPTDCAVIVNPAAANGRCGRHYPFFVAELKRHGFLPEVFLTSGPGDATELTRKALGSHDTVIAVGGDGTTNEVVNGFFREGRPVNPAARLGIISCGTGADLVKTLGLPAGAAAIPHLAQGNVAWLDLGLATFRDRAGRQASRNFVNFADFGMGGETAARANRTTKAFGGFASFLWASIATILTFRGKVVELVLDDAPVRQERICLVVIANGRYFGGGMKVAPTASITDGLFDVLILDDVSKTQLLFELLPRVYRGTHVDHPAVWSGQARRVVARSREELLLDLDGELAGLAEAACTIVPATLPVLAPEHFSATQGCR